MTANKHVKKVDKNPIEPKTYKKEAKQNKYMKAETKQTDKNLGFLGNGVTHARTGLRAQVRLCVSKSLPKKPKNAKTEYGHKGKECRSRHLVIWCRNHEYSVLSRKDLLS